MMRFLIPLLLLVGTIVAEDATEIKEKRGTASKSNTNANSLQEVSGNGKQPVAEEAYVEGGDQPQPGQNPTHQAHLQGQYLIPAQYLQQLQQYQQRPPGYQQYVGGSPHHQPVAMVIIPHSHSQPQQQQQQQYSHPYANNPLFNQAAQQLLNYYHTHPQARLQLLQGYQGHQTVQVPQYQPAPQYQAAPQYQQIPIPYTTHPQLSAQFALAPTSHSNHLPTGADYQQLSPAQVNAINAQYQQQYQQTQSSASSPHVAFVPSQAPHQAHLNTNEFLPQPEKLSASGSSYQGPYSVRQFKGRF